MIRPDIDTIAQALLDAYSSREPLQPLTATYPGLDADDAYAIQSEQVKHWTARGASIKGYKIGLTSQAMQELVGVTEPDYGCLVDTMFGQPGSAMPIKQFIQPMIEPEIAFVLGADLVAPATIADVVRATEYVMPALEVIDSRIASWQITLVDTVADNASSGAVVLGGQPHRLDGIDLALTGCNLYVNGKVAATGATGAVLGNPMGAVAWLANALGRHNVALRGGHIVLSGACLAAVPVHGGDVVSAQFSELGVVNAHFSDDELG